MPSLEILSVYDMQQQSANGLPLSKADVLQQHSLSRGFVTSIFVDDSEQEISNPIVLDNKSKAIEMATKTVKMQIILLGVV